MKHWTEALCAALIYALLQTTVSHKEHDSYKQRSGMMTEEDIKEWTAFMKILRDSSMTKEQKLEKVQEILENKSPGSAVKALMSNLNNKEKKELYRLEQLHKKKAEELGVQKAISRT
ncbi:unnamed protein product [Cylicocyclus nassatus]|uniref:Uncharacterized protein n=1 Tax=Cylicocyclus nassatus TaxID=53992 RepID=A0AA36M9C5_CYLNA|nr:unnamed protein product [Cylicocyclus nassatus]